MENKNITALISAYARYYHANYPIKIFDDNIASLLLTAKEKEVISESLAKGIHYFNKNFVGTKDEALRWIIDNQISPIMLARSAYAEKALERDLKLGCKSYLIFASGFDSYAYRSNSKLKIFEIDKKTMIENKKERIKKANLFNSKVTYISTDFTKKNWFKDIIKSGYNQTEKSFSSLLGITYYLTKKEFINTLMDINSNISEGSTIIFDYPTKEESVIINKNAELASLAGEKWKAKYSYLEIEKMLEKNNFLIYEHLNSKEITKHFFSQYNEKNKEHLMCAPKGIEYILAVKK